MSLLLAPPVVPPAALASRLAEVGHAVMSPGGLREFTAIAGNELNGWQASWDDLPPDAYLRDGGHYRRRRHACFVVDADRASAVPPRAHWQPVEYNALHGGIERWFEPMQPAIVATPAWLRLLCALGRAASQLRGEQPWFVEAHQFRIDTEGGIGRPTPEGAHRDGVDLVAVLLVARVAVKGGETRVFDSAGPNGLRFTMTEPWTTLLLDDARVVHESTPIQPLKPGAFPAHRDTLVLTYRAGGFQGPG